MLIKILLLNLKKAIQILKQPEVKQKIHIEHLRPSNKSFVKSGNTANLKIRKKVNK